LIAWCQLTADNSEGSNAILSFLKRYLFFKQPLLPLIMSISKNSITELKQSNDSTQLGEPIFFTRLPTEIRLLIYENLFGWRTVHIWQHYLGWDGIKLASFRWSYRLCCRDPQRDFMQHMACCSDGVLRYPQLDTSILFTCRQA